MHLINGKILNKSMRMQIGGIPYVKTLLVYHNTIIKGV